MEEILEDVLNPWKEKGLLFLLVYLLHPPAVSLLTKAREKTLRAPCVLEEGGGQVNFFNIFFIRTRWDTPSFMLPTFDEIVRRYCNFERIPLLSFSFFFSFQVRKIVRKLFRYFETLMTSDKGNSVEGRFKGFHLLSSEI